jgi:hypothetical protein
MKDKEYLKKAIFKKMESQDTSIIWKFLFHFMVTVHIVVLVMLLLYGTNENF